MSSIASTTAAAKSPPDLTLSEQSRIRRIYHAEQRASRANLYQWQRSEVRIQRQEVQELFATLLLGEGLTDLSDLSVLDMGCGIGRFLRSLLEWGAKADNLHGIDLIESRIEEARELSPNINFEVGNGLRLPYVDCQFRVSTSWVVLSSITDPDSRAAYAEEMLRVTRPGGYLMIYDFIVSDPRNPNTVAIPRREINRLFPNMLRKTKWTTLAPPISRRLGSISPALTRLVSMLMPMLSTHRMYWLRKPL